MELFIVKDIDANINLAVFTDHGKALEFRKNLRESVSCGTIEIEQMFSDDGRVINFTEPKINKVDM